MTIMNQFLAIENILLVMFCYLSLTDGVSNSNNGILLVTSLCYLNSVGLTVPNIELTNVDELQCRRQCAMRESCKACQVFIHSTIQQRHVCNLYLDSICDYSAVTMYYNSNITKGAIWEKISGNNINNARTCTNQTNCNISSPLPSLSTSSGPLQTNQTTSVTNVTTIPSSSPTVEIVTQKPAESRPRTCWDYHLLDSTFENSAVPRTVWPTGLSNGTSITVYCKNGYTIILSNFAKFTAPFLAYEGNAVTVFGSMTQTINKDDNIGWNNYVSNINFPILSALIRISDRILYYEQVLGLPFEAGTYSGLDITPGGTLTVEGNIQVAFSLGTPPDMFPPPLINSTFVNSTCGSFWKIPTTSSDICSQTTNMLLLAVDQKVGGRSRSFITLAFK